MTTSTDTSIKDTLYFKRFEESAVESHADAGFYELVSGSFVAIAGHYYVCDTTPTSEVPAVPSFLVAAGLRFTGDSATKVAHLYFSDFGSGNGQDFDYDDDNGRELHFYFSGGQTTLQNIISIFPYDGIICELAPGASGSDIFAPDNELLGSLAGGQAAYDEPIPVEVTLPANPATGDVIGFADARGTWGSNPLVVLRNGKKIEGAAANFVNNAAGTFFSLVYIDATTGWRVLASGTKPLNLVPPSISGSYRQTAAPGEWTGSPTGFAYQWQHSADGLTGWANVAGATASSFTPADYEGEYVRVGVVASNANGPSLVAYSEASGEIVVPTFPMDGLVAFWKLADLTDASGNGHTLTNNNSVSFVDGKIGDAALCSSGYLTSGATLCNPEQAMTVAAWFKTTNSENENHFIFGDESNGSNYFLLMEHGGRLYVNLGGMSQVGPSVAINDGEWHHAALVWNGATLKIYVDGAAGPSQAMTDSISPISVNIGADESGDYVFGNAIDAAGAWNRALSAEEILLLYNNGEGVEL